jgi:transcriptional regulator with XRE-family HTH domain
MTERGVTGYEVERNAGIDQAVLSRYFHGKVAMSIKSLTKLLDYLGYELTIRKKRKTRTEKTK